MGGWIICMSQMRSNQLTRKHFLERSNEEQFLSADEVTSLINWWHIRYQSSNNIKSSEYLHGQVCYDLAPSISRCYNMQMCRSGCRRTQGSQRARIGQTVIKIFHQFVYSVSSTRCLRKHNVADLKAAFVCIAQWMGQDQVSKTDLLSDEGAQTKDVNASIISCLNPCA